MSDPTIRDDFPIDWEEDQYVSRREFFKFMTLASGAFASGSTGLTVWSSVVRQVRMFEPKRLCAVDDLSPEGSLAFNYPREEDICLLIRTAESEFKAYSRRCTHLSCPVDWEPRNKRLYCPCHNGAFDVENGEVLQGPPPHALPRILLEIRNAEVWAVGVRKGDGE